jgi:hypothetical protein
MSWVWTELQWDADGNLVSAEGCEWDGPVGLCKGSSVANDQRKQELAMQQQAFNMQQQQLKFLNDSFGKYVNGDIGFNPQQLAAMNSAAMGQNAQQFGSAESGVRAALASRGVGMGDSPVGGEFTRGLSSLYGARASDLAGSLRNVILQNGQQALANKFNAGSILSGNAATLNGAQSTAGAGASSALNAYIQAANSGFGASFMSSLGKGLGGGLASAAMGGLGGFISPQYGGTRQ